MAAVAINNHLLQQEMSLLLDSFMSLMLKRLTKNQNIRENIVDVFRLLWSWQKEFMPASKQGPFASVKFTPEDMYELRVASWLHDVGKINP